MTDFNAIDPYEIKEGILLNEDQTTYISMTIKDTKKLLASLRQSIEVEWSKAEQGASRSQEKAASIRKTTKCFKKLESDLEYCVTILRKDHVL